MICKQFEIKREASSSIYNFCILACFFSVKNYTKLFFGGAGEGEISKTLSFNLHAADFSRHTFRSLPELASIVLAAW